MVVMIECLKYGLLFHWEGKMRICYEYRGIRYNEFLNVGILVSSDGEEEVDFEMR